MYCNLKNASFLIKLNNRRFVKVYFSPWSNLIKNKNNTLMDENNTVFYFIKTFNIETDKIHYGC